MRGRNGRRSSPLRLRLATGFEAGRITGPCGRLRQKGCDGHAKHGSEGIQSVHGDVLAAALDPADFSPVSSIAEEPQSSSEESVDDPNEMSLAQLKERAKALGLSATGSKADLIERITLNSGTPEAGEETDGDITND